jgi:UMF1 family MFS transporter
MGRSEGGTRKPLLERLVLHRPQARAWALYDVGNSAFFTTVITAVYPVYYASVARAAVGDRADQWFTGTTVIAMTLIAILAPLMGAMADYSGAKKRLLVAFAGLGILSTAAMFFVVEGSLLLASGLFVAANIGVVGSIVFYDALLPYVAETDELDQLSTTGFAIGYLGGGILLALNVAMITSPHWFGIPDESGLPVRFCFVTVAVWWALFTIPVALRVPEPPRRLETDERPGEGLLRTSVRRIGETFHELREYRQAFLLLIAILVYSDGIGTVIRMAGFYAKDLGLDDQAVVSAFLLTQFVAFPCAIGFGWLAARIGPKRSILIALFVYVCVCIYAYFLSSESEFFVMAVAVGMIQGGAQALSRSTFASMIPRHKSAEFFGFYVLGEKFAGVLGPGFILLVTALGGSMRIAVLATSLFFIVGAILLSRVRIDEGRRAAREAEERLLGESA